MNTRTCLPLPALVLLFAGWSPTLLANDHTGKLKIENNCVHPLFVGFEGKNIFVSNQKSPERPLEIRPHSSSKTVLKEKTYKLRWAGERRTVSVKIKDDHTTTLNLTRRGYEHYAEVSRKHRVRDRGVLVRHSPPRPTGHYEIQRQRVLVSPAHFETRTTPAVYQTRYTRCGKAYRVMIHPAQSVRVWVPDQYEIREVRVWVPATRVCTRPPHHAPVVMPKAVPIHHPRGHSIPGDPHHSSRSSGGSCSSSRSRSNIISLLVKLF